MYTESLTMGMNGFFDAGGGLERLTSAGTKVAGTVQQVGTAVSVFKNAVKKPGANTTPAYTPQPQPTVEGPNYAKIALIVAAAAITGYVGYRVVKG